MFGLNPSTPRQVEQLQKFDDTKVAVNRRVAVMLFNYTFNNISVISWRSFLLVEETGVLGENH
jgi:hypothetical protein